MTQVSTKWIEDNAVDKDKINADIAGLALTQAAGGELDVGVDDSTIEVFSDALRVKALGIDTGHLAAQAVTAAKLGAVAGNGIGGGAGSVLTVTPDTTGGANLAKAVNVSANGVALKIDDDTIGENGSNQLYVKANSIGATEIDETDSYTWITGSHDFTGASSVSVPTPTQDAHAATKGYLDAAIEGRTPKGVARALANSNQTLSGLPTTIDGVTGWSNDDLILLTNQTSADENGIWAVNSSAWSRPTNFDTGSSAAGASIWINAGTTYDDQRWVCTTDAPNDIVDTNDLAWQFDGGMTAVTAGTGLTKNGNEVRIGDGSTGNINGINRTADEISAAVDDTTIEIASNLLQIKNLGVSTAKLAATSVTAAKLGSDVAGDGLTGGNGSAIDVLADPTGGANLATVMNVSTNGVALKIDDSTIGENGSNQLYIKADGITKTEINSDVAGDGLSQAAGGELDVDINGLVEDNAPADGDFFMYWDVTEGALNKVAKSDFLASSGEVSKGESHKITAGEVTAGYFTLANTPAGTTNVVAFPNGGPPQINKQHVGATGVTPDFDILSSNQFHFNNNGAATGLSEHLAEDDIVNLHYAY